jgi:HSP20 family protein
MNTLTTFNPFRSTGWNPLRDLRSLENRLERIFGRSSLMDDDGEEESLAISHKWSPRVDITEDEKEYLVKAELPELRKEDVKVTIENGQLIISGERKFEKEDKSKKYHRVEFSYGNFLRTFTLPDGVESEKVVADFKDGVMKIHLPKNAKAKPKAVEVNVQ